MLLNTPPFQPTGQTFAERTGEPDEFTSAIGRISVSFAELSVELDRAIGERLALDADLVEIITSEMSFRDKVHLLSSLVQKLYPTSMPFTGDGTLEDYLKELVARTFEAEQHRNRILHATWIGPFLRDSKAKLRKATAKAATGHRVRSEEVDSGYLLDVSDFICETAGEVDGFRQLLAQTTPNKSG